MTDESVAISLRDNARADLMQIKSIEEGVTYLNKVKSIEVWVKAEKKDAELQNIIAEQKLRTQRILGKLLKDGQQRGEIKTSSSAKSEDNNSIPSLGITHKQSSTFQQIASIPEKAFNEFIREKKEAVNEAVAELTTAGAVRLAKSLKHKEEDLDTAQRINKQLDTERELRTLAIDLRKKYTKDEIQLLVKFLTK
jgi:hypothetical protein